MRGGDTETTGVDTRHGAKPFFWTMCRLNESPEFYEWDVDPLTREPIVPKGDLDEILDCLLSEDEWVFQNAKFDAGAMNNLDPRFGKYWPWKKMKETLFSAHLLASNQPKDLTTQALIYLHINIKPVEEAIDQAVTEARRIARSKYPRWKIAKKGLEGMPSAKEKVGKFDMWLPRAIAIEEGYPADHPWWTVLQEYANADSSIMVPLHLRHMEMLEERDLVSIYQERLKLLSIVHGMESQGIPVSQSRLNELLKDYREASEQCGRVCVNIAASMGHELVLPKGSSNGSLLDFCESPTGLNLIPLINPNAAYDHGSGGSKDVTGAGGDSPEERADLREERASTPGFGKLGRLLLNKNTVESFQIELWKKEPKGKRVLFLDKLKTKRGFDTSISYMESYVDYARPVLGESHGLPSLIDAALALKDQENPELLDLDWGSLLKWLRSIQSNGGNQSPQSVLSAIRGTDTGGLERSSQMRQSGLRQSQASIPRDDAGQHERYDREGEGRQGQRNEASRSEDNRSRRARNAETHSGGQVQASGFMPQVQLEPAPSMRDNQKKILEAYLGDWYTLYPSLNPTGTGTLRFSSQCPNEQNISKKTDENGRNLRYCFGPMPGREWWSLDAKNIELRIPAYEAGEDAMIELFERPDDPPYYGSNHLFFFDILHPEKFAQHGAKVKKVYADTWYQWTKNGDFAVQYGAVAESGTADRAYHMVGAQAKIEGRLTNIKRLSRQMIDHANQYGYVNTMPDRTVNPDRGYPLLCTRNRWGGVLETVPLSYHVQGTAMWVMCRMMVKVSEFLAELSRKRKQRYSIIIQVHDEIVLDFPRKNDKGNLPIVMEVKRLMDSVGYDLIPSVPLPVGIEYHTDNWATGETCA